MANVFATLRVTGQTPTGVARGLLAQLQSFIDACEAQGVEVKRSVDLTDVEPEPVQVVAIADVEPSTATVDEPQIRPARKSRKGAK
jgi:hypothetical protein